MSYIEAWTKQRAAEDMTLAEHMESGRDFATGILCGAQNAAESVHDRMVARLLKYGTEKHGEGFTIEDAEGLLDVLVSTPVLVIGFLLVMLAPLFL